MKIWPQNFCSFKNCQFSSFLTFSMSVEKNCLHYTDTFLAKSKKASKKSVKRRLGAPFAVERRARVRSLLSCSRKILFTFFSCALDFCAATACFKVVFHRKKNPSEVFSEFLAMILAINWKVEIWQVFSDFDPSKWGIWKCSFYYLSSVQVRKILFFVFF